MSTTTWIVVAIVAVIVLAVMAIAVAAARRRRQRLQDRFGTEYDRTLERADKRRDAERDLRGRIDLRDELDIRPLSPAARDRYAEQWQRTQTRFVDQPAVVVMEADSLVTDVMRERGYPVDNWEQREALVSVDHPQVVDDYRVAHDVAGRSRANDASTDDLREAFLRYRSLFEALLATDERESRESAER
jgi:hypothetical protein